MAVRVWRGVRGLVTNFRREGCVRLVREVGGVERWDGGLIGRAEHGRRRRRGVGFMLAWWRADAGGVWWSIGRRDGGINQKKCN